GYRGKRIKRTPRLRPLQHRSKTKTRVVRGPLAGFVTQLRSDADLDALQVVPTLIGRQERGEAMRERREPTHHVGDSRRPRTQFYRRPVEARGRQMRAVLRRSRKIPWTGRFPVVTTAIQLFDERAADNLHAPVATHLGDEPPFGAQCAGDVSDDLACI